MKCGRESSRAIDLASIVVIAAFAAGQAYAFVPAVPMNGTDQGTLLLTARALSAGSSGVFTIDQPHLFIADQLLLVGSSRYVSKYPIGYPFLCAVAHRFAGADAVFLINPVAGVLGLLGAFWMARLLAGSAAAFVATLILACDPVVSFFAASTMTHTTAATAGVWGMLCLWRWCEAGSRSALLLCGALAAAATSFRYVEAILFLPIVALFVLHTRADSRLNAHVQAGVLMAGALLVFVPMGIYQWIALGSPFRTGYSLTNESTAFSVKWMWQHTPLLVRQMFETGFLPVGVTGLVGIALIRGRVGLFLACWIAPILLATLAYYHRDNTIGDLRLSLSAFAPLAIAASVSIASLRVHRHLKTALAVGLIACVVPRSLPSTIDALESSHSRLAASQSLTAAVTARAPRGSAIWVRTRLHYDLDFRDRYRIFDASILESGVLAGARLMLEQMGPIWIQRERIQALARWIDIEEAAASVRAEICSEIATGRRVFFIDEEADSRKPAALLETVQAQEVDRWTQHLDFPDGTDDEVVYAIYEITAANKAGNATESRMQCP